MKDVSKDHPDVMKKLEAMLASERAELGDDRQKVAGDARRPIGHVEGGKSVWDQATGKAQLHPQQANAAADAIAD